MRKQIIVRNVDGEEGPRVAPLAYLTLSFDPLRVTLPRANRFMSELVRVLEGIARDLGHERVYCATGTAGSLLRRSGFAFREDVVIEGACVAIFEKALV